MMTILFTSRWNSFLIAFACWRLANCPPYSYGRDSSLGMSSHIHELACWRLANCSPILLWESLLFGHVFTYPWSSWGWQASSIWSLRDGSSWTCTSFLHSSSCWCLEVAWGLTSSSSSRHTWHLISFINFFLLQPWSQHMVQELPMDNSYKYNSMQTLVHRDCH